MKLYDYDTSANCFKVRLLLAQLERPFERVPLDIFAGDTLTDEFAAINPQRSTPVLELDDGRRLVESNAILFYIAQGTEFLPDDTFERAEIVRWLIFDQLDVMSTMVDCASGSRPGGSARTTPTPYAGAPVRTKRSRCSTRT